MTTSPPFVARTDQDIAAAFNRDGFDISSKVMFKGQRGFKASHRSAFNTVTGQHKTAYYVEGSSYEMGYLIGMMAADEVELMVTEFESAIIPSLIHKDGPIMKLISDALMAIVKHSVYKNRDLVPASLMQEITGIDEGCRAKNPNSKADVHHLLALNMGIDVLLAAAYDPESVLFRTLHLRPEDIHTDRIGCNGFSVFGRATSGGRHYMGRDFMFPTAGVFQDLACMIVYNPNDTFSIQGATRRRLPTIAMTAPGFVGSIAALNANGIGVGVDMLPAANDSLNPGLNSLMLVRYTADFAQSATDAVNLMVDAPRGVSWLYLIGDGAANRAVVLEAGKNTDAFDPFSYPDPDLFKKGLLPDQSFFSKNEKAVPRKGLVARWNDYAYPSAFLDFNQKLFSAYGKSYQTDMMDREGFINTGYISGSYKEPGATNNPQAYYFAPQRENNSDMLLVTNMAITPTMRLCGMHPHTVAVAGEENLSQMQWRYDALNKEILNAYGQIDEKKGWDLINFLNPFGSYPNFYGHGKTPDQYKEITVQGSTSLLNLTDKTMKSLYGYFGDAPVTLSLPSYV